MIEKDQQGGEVKAGAKVLILGHKCYRCGHEWRPNDLDKPPRVCPKCKNPYWDRPRQSSDKNRKSSDKKTGTQKNGKNNSQE